MTKVFSVTGLSIECVVIAGKTKKQERLSVLSFAKIYYQLTQDIPRPLPQTKEELESLKLILVHAFGLEDKPENWYRVSSELQATAPTSTHKSYRKLVNVARRIRSNEIAQNEKIIAGTAINAKLEATIKRLADEEAQKANIDEPGPLSPISEPDGSEMSDRTHRIPGEL